VLAAFYRRDDLQVNASRIDVARLNGSHRNGGGPLFSYRQSRCRSTRAHTWASRGVVVGVATALCLTVTGPPSAGAAEVADARVSAAEIATALDDTTGVLSAADEATDPAADGAAAVVSSDALTAVVPSAGDEGVALTVAGTELTVSLPSETSDAPARQLDDGTVVYPSDDGSASAVVAGERAVQMLTVIATSQAATDYSYQLELPAGGRVELTQDGGAAVLDATNQPVLAVPAPWATDADGSPVATHFTTDGRSLTQVVDHDRAGVAYPVVADPLWFVIRVPIFWWAVGRCGAGGILDAVVAYTFGERSGRALAAAGASGCLANLVGGWGILRHLIRIVRW
jgi:hypothetical protein